MNDKVEEFEYRIADFFGAPFAVAVDSCTHGVELALRFTRAFTMVVPKRTYPSIPMLAYKLGLELEWVDEDWYDYYYITTQVIDAAVLWRANSYIRNTFMCVSFQYQKHLSLGRGGVILTDNAFAALKLKKMSYDGRLPGRPWREQNIDTIGYHYYMTPETAELGLEKLDVAIKTPPEKWTVNDYPYLTKMDIFNE